ncbi:MAG: serine/threonine protein kinase [Phycisphaerae bacterium]|nr:serine/threonine protein kinase [Phycisphaerae bacterium]
MERDRHSRAAGSADPSASRDVAVGRLLHEYLERRACGQAESQAEFLAAHPELADELRLHLGLVRSAFDGSGTLHGLIHQGVLRASADPRFPAELGPYKISALLGRGGMGIVLLAHEESLNRRVALKILRPDLGNDPVALARFTREAKAAAGLRHPNIVDIHAVGQERGVHFLAMEYVDGPTLAEVLRRATDGAVEEPPDDTATSRESPVYGSTAAGLVSRDADRPAVERAALPADVVRTLFRQLLSGLAAAHGAGLVHRDIKSSNLLLDFGTGQTASDRTNPATATLKIADFGLARMVVSQTRLTIEAKTLGTPEYMSPEQARGDEAIDHRADLYSAGVVLYEMLTGRTPFRDATPTGIIHRILHDEPPHPRAFDRGADPALASLALRLMAKRPEDRFATADKALAALEAGTTVRSRERRRRRRRRAAAVLAVLSVLTLAGWWLIGLSNSGPLRHVKIDDTDPLTIVGCYGRDTGYRVVRRFPEQAGHVAGLVPLALDAKGTRAVAAVLSRPLDDAFVFLMDEQGNTLRRVRGLVDDEVWPDERVHPLWHGIRVVAGDLDGTPGDELVVALKDSSGYGTHIAAIDPRTGSVLSSFWHMGHAAKMFLYQGFFATEEGTRPALVVWGEANKLDGFDDQVADDPWRLTVWERVSVIMVLDPLNMDGLGPPPTNRLDKGGRAPVYAYAFMDAASVQGIARMQLVDERLLRDIQKAGRPEDIVGIEQVRPKECLLEDGPCVEIAISSATPGGGHGALLDLNRHLEIVGCEPVEDRPGPRDVRKLWRVVVREGQDWIEAPAEIRSVPELRSDLSSLVTE